MPRSAEVITLPKRITQKKYGSFQTKIVRVIRAAEKNEQEAEKHEAKAAAFREKAAVFREKEHELLSGLDVAMCEDGLLVSETRK